MRSTPSPLPPGRRLADQPAVILWLAGLIAAAHGARLLAPLEWKFWAAEHLAVIPARFSDPGAALSAIFGHVFVHAGFLHLAFNLFLFLSVGGVAAWRLQGASRPALRFLALFFGAGAAGALAYVWINPGGTIGAVGASGAICGVFGAYLLAARPSWREAIRDPAVLKAGFWFLAINVGLAALARFAGVIPIAWEAHLGGFVGGAALYPLLAPKPSPRPWTQGPWG